jgi:predicted TIM-barrel fold metal-dependent hydrolase
VDTVTYNRPAVNMILDWIGPDQTIYSSDAPPLTALKRRAVKLVQELNITTADKEKILAGNARQLLKLS